MSRAVRYRCPDHGGFVAQVRCGYGSGRAPDSVLCPSCEAPSVRDASPLTKKPYPAGARRVIVLDAMTADRLDAYCAEQGITIDACLDAMVPDAEGKP